MVAERVDDVVGWHELPRSLGLVVLIGLRSRLRAHNLFDAGPHPDGPAPPPAPADTRVRTIDGTYTDLDDPRMGSAGSLFGRNVAPGPCARPEAPDAVVGGPSPRLVSRQLLARDDFRPATSLNLLAAAWIQFEVHDWMSHFDATAEAPWEPELAGDDPWPQAHCPMRVNRTLSRPGTHANPTVYPNRDTHWWDGSQIYGSEPTYADAIREWDGGRIVLGRDGLPPVAAEESLDPNGPIANTWVGLALLQSLFLKEHNAICRRLHSAYPEMTDQQLYDTARLANTALMAKIHTVDWTPAIIAHPTTVAAMRGNWFGLLGEKFGLHHGRVFDSEVLSGIPGGRTDFHGVPYSLTEDFVAVYRMHPLLPDELTIREAGSDRPKRTIGLSDLLADDVRPTLGVESAADLFHSFGRAHPGALDLHNFPNALRELPRPDGSLMDLATVDILRNRERGVPRYNEFRRQLRLRPAKTFDDLTDNPKWACELARVYDGDVEQVDLMVGLYAETRPQGFGFSDTAFRVFILMASRRISSDRFLTVDFRPEIYTEVGMSWVRQNSMRSVLLRHFPTLAPTLADVANPFAPWPAP
nr:peroxidase family protein [Gordonia insulae]